MNKVILMGRLVRDPEVRYSQGDNSMAFASFTVAVDRRMRRTGAEGEQTADFIRCVAFRQQAEFAEKYLHQGIKIALTGRIQTGSYVRQDGQKVYTTDVIVEEIEFAESKAVSDANRANASMGRTAPAPAGGASGGGADALEGFMNIPDTIEEDLPFN